MLYVNVNILYINVNIPAAALPLHLHGSNNHPPKQPTNAREQISANLPHVCDKHGFYACVRATSQSL